MIDYNQYELDKEYRNRQKAEAEQNRLVQIAKAAQPEPDYIGFIRSYLNHFAGKLEQAKPEAQPQQPEFKQKPASSTNS